MPRLPAPHEFTLAGRRFSLSQDDVRASLDGAAPGHVQQYWVEIDGVRWPVKQVLGLATGLPHSDFQSQSARRLLSRLSFRVGNDGGSVPDVTPATPRAPRSRSKYVPPAPNDRAVDVVVISCVKTKLGQAAPARDLYISDYFIKMRRYAEQSGLPWYILSAQYGLVAPDEVLEPYDCYLPDMGRDYRRDWGRRVARQLQEAIGPLDGTVIDLHASGTYADAVREGLDDANVAIIEPCRGLTIGQRKAWYLGRQAAEQPHVPEQILASLTDESLALPPGQWLEVQRRLPRAPGLYAWWVDDAGADELTLGLGHPVQPGLVYVGQAGATRSRGGSSNNTLLGRIGAMHLGSNRRVSTLRRSIAGVLAIARRTEVSEADLTAWMNQHLRVSSIDVTDRDSIDALERQLFAEIDPPLNLRGLPNTPPRRRLSQLRRSGGSVGSGHATSAQ